MREYIKVGRGSLAILLGRGLGIVFSILITVILTRTLGQEGYGIFSYAFSIPLLVIGVLSTTLSISLARYVPHYGELKQLGKVKTIFIKILKLTLIISILTALVLFFASYFFPYSDLIKISLPYLVLGTMVYVFAALFLNLKKMYLYVVEYFLPRGLILGMLIFLIPVFGVTGAIIGYSIATLLTLIFISSIAFNYLRKIKMKKIKFGYRKIISISFPMGMASILGSINEKINIFILTYFAFIFGMGEVGFFNLAFGVLFIIIMLMTSITDAAKPTIIGYYSRKRGKIVQYTFNLLMKYILIIILPIIISVPFIINKIVVFIFGSEFLRTVPLIEVLSIGLIFHMFYKLISPVIIAFDKFNYFLYNEIITFVLIITLSFLLVPNYGSLGAAISYLTGLAISRTLLIVKGLKISKIKLNYKSVVKISLSSLVFLLFTIFPTHSVIMAVLSGAVLLGVYASILLLTKTISKSDMNMFLSLTKK